MRGVLLLLFLPACAPDLEGVDPLPAGNGYRDPPWVQHPDNPFTRDVGGHPDGSRYVYYNDLSLFVSARSGDFASEGAVVVKEVYDEDDSLQYIAVMRRLPDHPDAERDDGWVYSISRDNGKTEQLSSVCKNCHVDTLSFGSLWVLPPEP